MLVTFGVIQAASDAFIRAPGTFSSLVPRAFGLRVYEFLDRVAPAPYVDETLAEDALSHGELSRAQHYAVRLSASPRRDDLLGRIAQARGEALLAMEYYFAAPDIERMQSTLYGLLPVAPAQALDMERRFGAHLQTLRTHPDAVADSHWYAGIFADALHRPQEALREYRAAAQLAPFNVKYLIYGANEAWKVHADAEASALYRRGLAVNPACGDCLAGLGLIALRGGDRVTAQADAARARTVQPGSQMLRELDRELR